MSCFHWLSYGVWIGLEPTKDQVLEKYNKMKGGKVKNLDPILNTVSGHQFHNISRFTFKKLKEDPDNIAANLAAYIKGFSGNARNILINSVLRRRLRNWTGTTDSFL